MYDMHEFNQGQNILWFVLPGMSISNTDWFKYFIVKGTKYSSSYIFMLHIYCPSGTTKSHL